MLTKTRIIAVIFVLLSAVHHLSSQAETKPQAGAHLPKVFASVLSELKAGTGVPVLLPTELTPPFSDAKNAVVDKAEPDEYGLALYYALGSGDAGFAGSFTARRIVTSSPKELPDGRAVSLAGGIVGVFRPISCGGSCAPANLWWSRDAVLYNIQLRIPTEFDEKKQREIIVKVANSAIQAGPR